MRFMKRPLEGACLGKNGFVSHPRGGECSPHALHPSHCPRLAPWTIKAIILSFPNVSPEPVLLNHRFAGEGHWVEKKANGVLSLGKPRPLLCLQSAHAEVQKPIAFR
eukprot:COSAG06_NODE_6067_length_3128_cov_1.654011_2_plen_107_part_00